MQMTNILMSDFVISDSKWKLNEETSILNRGIRDYDRYIEFRRSLDFEELSEIKTFMKKEMPTTSPIYAVPVGGNMAKYRFMTTVDSSD